MEYKYNAVVTNVVDGDTVDAVVDLGFTVSVSVRFRLYGIDTKEIRDKNPEIREHALRAKSFVIDKLLGQEVLVKSYKTDKYGRWLGEFFVNGEEVSVNNQLVEQGLAEEYFGGKKR